MILNERGQDIIDVLQRHVLEVCALPKRVAVVAGEETLFNRLNYDNDQINIAKIVNEGSEEALEELRATQTVYPYLKKLSDQCIAAQKERMQDEELGLKPLHTRHYLRDLIQKDLVDISNDDSGYIIWLDARKRDDNGLSLFEKQPLIFDPTSALTSSTVTASSANAVDSDNESCYEVDFFEEEENNQQERPPEQCRAPTRETVQQASEDIHPGAIKHMINGAKVISSAARSMLSAVYDGKVDTRNATTFTYDHPALTPSELEFYQLRKTKDQVLKLRAEDCNSAREKTAKWEALPLGAVDEETRRRITAENEARIAYGK